MSDLGFFPFTNDLMLAGVGGAPPYGYDLAYESQMGQCLFYLRYMPDGSKHMFDENWKLIRTLQRGESVAVSRRDRCKLVPSEESRVETIKRIFAMYVQDKRGFKAIADGEKPLSMADVLTAMIKAHEIQGVIALENGFNRVGLDHVLLVRVATTAVATAMLGGSREQVIDALSNAWIDGGALRTYRHAPNTGSRKSWAAGDATSRGVWLALTATRGEMGYPSALSTPNWGFQDVLFKGNPLSFSQGYGTHVMENVLFKVSFPAEFHAQTAVEAAVTLHPQVKDRVDDIDRISIETQESGVRIIDKTGALHNPADRDHCIQYMVAVALIKGNLTAEDYEDDVAADPRIDALRDKMQVNENERFSEDYLDPHKRSIANAVQVFFADGTKTDRIEVDYPMGHRRRRGEGIPLLNAKFERNIATRLNLAQCERIFSVCNDQAQLESTPVDEFIGMWVV